MDFDAAPEEFQPLIAYIKKLFDTTSENLKYEWEAWILKQTVIPELSTDSLNAFKDHLQSNLGRSSKRQKPMATPQSNRVVTTKTPKTHHKPTAVPPSDPPSSPAFEKFQARTDSGTIEKKFGNPIECSPGPSELVVTSSVEYKTMYTKLNESTTALDDDIEMFIESMVKEHNIDEKDICNPAISSQQETWAIGRLIATRSSFGAEDIHIQTCRRFGSGSLVPLDVSGLAEFTFFEGQIVALKGNNPMGDCFVARKLLELPVEPVSGENKDASIIVAVGPFTTSDNLQFAPLKELVEVINTQSPSLVVLMGPFIEPNHPLVLAGDVGDAQDMEQLFKARVSPILQQITVPSVLVPADVDDFSGHVPFPQPPLPKKRLQIPQECRCAANPAKFTINGLNVVASNTSILQDISSNGYKKSSKSLPFKHLIEQRSLYPLFPPARSVDLPNMYQAKLESTPHVLLVPSPMQPTIEVVHGVICINPGKLAKSTAAGRYLTLKVGSGKGSVQDRIEAKVVKI